MPKAPTVFVVKGGTVVDASGTRRADVMFEAGVITAVEENLDAKTVIDASGCIVAPGFVDLHTHLREPGREEAEDIETGTRAAALGGYTAVVAMPNTEPAIDNAELVRDIKATAIGKSCEVYPAGAITVGRKGEQLSPMAEMARAGVTLFTDDGAGVQDAALMRRALEYAKGLSSASGGGRRVTLAQHCEDNALAAGGSMHEGAWSSRLGIPGQPSSAETAMVLRDIELVRLTGAPMHFLHMSTAESLRAIAQAKAAGLPITAEVAPHHFTLTDACCCDYDATFKVNPPLRTEADVEAVKQALRDGIVDAIATDHAPHAPELKELPFDQAPPGMLGLETALAVALDELELPLEVVLGYLSWRPAKVAGLLGEHGNAVAKGSVANLCIIDPNYEWVVEGRALASKSRNTPYEGRKLKGKVRHTICRGIPTVLDGASQR
ncbi:MAG TPA: dihydroorotase [Acidimicrobiales bacterium]|nr:dihydroorotase [Acidimicrobiales bacterium]